MLASRPHSDPLKCLLYADVAGAGARLIAWPLEQPSL